MFKKGLLVVLLGGTGLFYVTAANAELVINSKDNQYKSVTEVRNSQIPSDRSIKQLMEIYDYDQLIEEVIGDSEGKRQAVISAMYSSMGVDINDTADLTEEQKTKLAKFNDMLDDYAEYIFENRKEEMQEIYKQGIRQTLQSIYTQEEIDAQIDFYSTPIGRDIVEKQTVFTKTYYESILPKIMAIQNENMQQAMIKLAEDITAIK
ncbi:DUF2059 domain-containing protein [Psychrobacter phenylpyruvicus]|uniref:Uncharacterized protein conserved in bacteria (DUF2059) n=2 Tax=Psychrobacter phenylpyruvicus TaxID=29432 RepID=A0A379LJL5_9GAMM|nr:DUF2059 domain-containing protein [Psychrobacter phenylpyruvicus]SUD89952.1 Uncharacterized protein conserved in bacteria (DUF2059) [Psychrobacter phenylpyruvicus]